MDPALASGKSFRTFVIIWATQSLSVLGSAIGQFAVTIWLTQHLYPLSDQKPQLAFALSAVAVAFSLPLLLGTPFAGTWTDSHNRRRTMLGMDFLNGVLSLLLT